MSLVIAFNGRDKEASSSTYRATTSAIFPYNHQPLIRFRGVGWGPPPNQLQFLSTILLKLGEVTGAFLFGERGLPPWQKTN
jgi:hypothetical protein